MRAAPDFMDQHAERIQRWKGIVRADPRRAVRTLTIRGMSAESLDGDTAMDSPYIMSQLMEIAKNREERPVWAKLVEAGVVAAL